MSLTAREQVIAMMASAGAGAAPQLAQCLVVDDADNSELNRTFGAGDNPDKWTFSIWVKRQKIGVLQSVISHSAGALHDELEFNADDTLEIVIIDTSIRCQLITTRKFRDQHAWYHIVVVWDSANATSGDRCRIYVNGVRETDFGTETYPSQNQDSALNSAVAVDMLGINGGDEFDGMVADAVFLDDYASTDGTEFGEFDSNGFWRWKSPTGLSYGSNGFRLDFADAADLGNDVSGNNNDWTETNISSSNQVADSPTINLCVMSDNNSNPTNTISNGGLTATGLPSANSNVAGSLYFDAEDADGYVFEVTPASPSAAHGTIGLVNAEQSARATPATTTDGFITITATGTVYLNGVSQGTFLAWADTNVVQFWIKAGELFYSVDGVNANSGSAVATGITGFWTPMLCRQSSGNTPNATFNFGQTAYNTTPAAGLKNISAFNLYADLVAGDGVVKPNDYFEAIGYQGDAVDDRDISGAAFQPDFVHAKNRDAADDHYIVDSSRGATISFALTAGTAEATTANLIQAFNSDGVQIGTDNAINTSGEDYILWCMKKLAGFLDIVLDAGTGSAKDVPHALGVTPEFMWRKEREGSTTHFVYHKDAASDPETDYARFHQSLEFRDLNTVWDDTAPDASDFRVGTHVDNNQVSDNYVTYLLASKPGLCQIGHYAGNGNNDGAFVPLRFLPRYIIIKRITAAAHWHQLDRVRSPHSPASVYLLTSSAAAEASATVLDWSATGVKIRTNSSVVNTNGADYAYLAFAEDPRQLLAA